MQKSSADKLKNTCVISLGECNTILSTYTFLPFSSNLKLSSANSLSLEESKICCPVIRERWDLRDKTFDM